MRTARLAAIGTAALIAGGCADGRSALGPTAPSLATAASARQVEASGEYVAAVDFSTLSLTPRGRNCLLEVGGQLTFTGTIEGTATGRTSALVFAACEEVMTSPPGTHPDVFKSELVFEGTVDGQAVQDVKLLYMGRVQPGGEIDGRLVFSNGVSGRLEADGRVAVGGTYRGSVVVH